MTSIDNQVGLDVEELTHLAVRLAAQERFDQAILYLKAALSQEPDNARANYFLGVQYAEIGMYERAIQRMLLAAQADSTLVLAPFQAGMLLMTLGRPDDAIAAWQALHGLDQEHPVHLFALGLEAMLRDDFATCKQYLLRGMAQNTGNEALNNDMRKVLNELQQRGLISASEDADVSPAVGLGAGAYSRQ